MKTIACFEDFLREHPAGPDWQAAKKATYKYTDCGAWINNRPNGIAVGSIVEGSDVEIGPYVLLYPFEMKDFWTQLDAVNAEACAAWDEANSEEIE